MIEAYPLQWPHGYPRTKERKSAAFKTTFAKTRDACITEIKRLAGKETAVVISTNLPLRRDGLPLSLSGKSQLQDPGVAVYFTYGKIPVTLACDKWDNVEDNLHAIRLTIEAMRGMERWGVSDMLNRAFTGFAQLPQHTEENWWDVLELRRDATLDLVKRQFKALANIYHPDKPTGNAAKFDRIRKAYDRAIEGFATSEIRKTANT